MGNVLSNAFWYRISWPGTKTDLWYPCPHSHVVRADEWMDVFLQRIGPLRPGRSAQHMVDCSTGLFIGTDLRIRRAHHLPSLESECESQNVLGIQSRESCHRTMTLQETRVLYIRP